MRILSTWTSKVPKITAHMPSILGIEAVLLGTLEVQVKDSYLRVLGPKTIFLRASDLFGALGLGVGPPLFWVLWKSR